MVCMHHSKKLMDLLVFKLMVLLKDGMVRPRIIQAIKERAILTDGCLSDVLYLFIKFILQVRVQYLLMMIILHQLGKVIIHMEIILDRVYLYFIKSNKMAVTHFTKLILK